MFGWLKNVFAKKSEENEKAFQMGRDMADQFLMRIEQLTKAKFNYIEQRYCEIFSKSLTDIVGQELKIPPIYYARALYANFLDEVKDAEVNSREELVSQLENYRGLFQEMDMMHVFNTAVDEKIGKFGENLRYRGLNILTDSVDFLKEIDDKWRNENPEIAENFSRE